MVRVFSAIVLLLVLLSGCTMDPCTFDKASPSCAVSMSQANATISAIDADRELRSTQSAIYLSGQGTKSAVSSEATKQVVQAEATQAAMNTEATRQAIGAAATQSAVVYASTQTFVNAEATKVYVQVGGAIERANAERAAVPYNAAFNVVVFWFLLPALVIIAIVVYGQRTVKRVTEAATQALHKRAAMMTYGPPNNQQLAFVTFDPQTGRPIKFITSEGLIGNYVDLLNGATVLDQLDVPQPMKLAALVEASKRTTAARIAAATGTAPWSVATVEERGQVVTNEPDRTIGIAEPVRVPTFAELLRTWKPTPERIIFGMIDGGPLYGRLDQLLSVIIVGRQEQGKTTLLRFIYAQCVLVGAEVQAWDIHEDIIEDLPGAAAFTSREAIQAIAERTLGELDRRIQAGEKRTARALMILIDELNSLMDAVPIVSEVIKRIVTEGRKYRIYCVVSCKGAPASEFGKSYIRDAFSARYAFNTTTRQASMVGFDTQDIEMVRRLLPGQALFDGPVVPCMVRIPLITADDVKALLPTSEGFSEVLRATSPTSGEVGTGEVLRGGEVAGEVGTEVDPKRDKIIDMLRSGASRNAIIKEVYGSTGGEKYQRASAEINQIQKELLQ